jgi:hypothetical protein
MSGKYWVTEPDAVAPIRMGSSGMAARQPITIIEVFKRTLANHGHRNALAMKRKVGVRKVLV